jgi:hypothetical protein
MRVLIHIYAYEVEIKLNGTSQLLVYGDDVNLLGDKIERDYVYQLASTE